MNRNIKIFSLLAVITMIFTVVSPALAQEGTPPTRGEGPLSGYLMSAFAATVGLSVKEVQARVNGGETLKQIAESLGYSDIMSTVASLALSEAVNDGAITPEQADRLANRERRKGQRAGEHQGALLEKLGLTQEELKALLDSDMTMQEILEQYGIELGDGPRKGEGGPGNGEGPPADGSKLTKQCGLTQEELQTRREAGEKLQDICPNEFPERPGKGKGPNQ